MKIIKLIASIASILLITSCSSTYYNTYPVTQKLDKQVGSGFYYALPKTCFNVEVTVEKIDYIKGPYADFAEKLLGLKNVIYTNSSSYQIVDVKLIPIQKVDTTQIYFVQTNDKHLTVNFYENIYLQSFNMKKNKLQGHKFHIKNSMENIDNENIPELFSQFSDFNIYETIDTVVRMVRVDSAVIEEKIAKTFKYQKTPQQKAEETAEIILKLKENRQNLLIGFQEINYDPKTLEFMTTQLKQQEDSYLKLFTGITTKSEKTYTFNINLDNNTDNKNSKEFYFAEFSNTDGIKANENNGKNSNSLYLRIDYSPISNVIKNFQTKNVVPSKNNLYYRIPQPVVVSTILDQEVLDQKSTSINQYGIVLPIDPINSQILFNPQGGIEIIRKTK